MATPARKELSTGTLNLKFMVRAAANDGSSTPALDKKKVIDEGEWDVGPEVRRALGISAAGPSTASASTSSSVSYEPSYMPFLNGAENTMKGRFSFKDGQKHYVESPDPSTIVEPEESKDGAGPSNTPTSLSHSNRPARISGMKPPKKASLKAPSGQRADSPPSPHSSSPPPPPAASSRQPTVPASNTFMRPAGVDAPSSARRANSNPKKRPAAAAEDGPKAKSGASRLDGKSGSSNATAMAGTTPVKKKKRKTHASAGAMDVDS